MRKLIMQMNVSLDGVADHTVAIADNELHNFSAEVLRGLDLLLFGRVTYQLMEGYWPRAHEDPQATRSMKDFADKFNAMPKIVFSSTLQEAGWQNSRIVRENAVEEVNRLKRQPGKNIGIGGISISRELMKHGLIDEYLLLVHPVVWGAGRRLFDGMENRINLRLVDTRKFRSGVIVLRYEAS
jgi:dihydrofolate reductase